MFTHQPRLLKWSRTLFSSIQKENSGQNSFPRSVYEMDQQFRSQVTFLKDELTDDAPYNANMAYRSRVEEIRDYSASYKGGDLGEFEYTEEEHEVWSIIYKSLIPYHIKHASEEYNEGKLELEKVGLFTPNRIPSLRDVSQYFEETKGFTLRPVTSIMEPRPFLNSFAFKIFHCTQYIRHKDAIVSNQEPDICHELIGHAPMLVNPGFAEFAHELGLATLGATDKEIDEMTSIFWYTFEFGLCLQNGQPKVYGAGIIPSIREIGESLSHKDLHRPFDLKKMTESFDDLQYTSRQLHYFMAPDFAEVASQIRQYSKTLRRSFDVAYDPDEARIIVNP